MLGNKKSIGITSDGQSLKLVLASLSGKRVVLEKFDTLELITPLEEKPDKSRDPFDDPETGEADDIFGIEEEELSDEVSDDLDLDSIDLFEDDDDKEEEREQIDLVDESDQPDTNELLLYNYLLSAGKRKHNIALSIFSGNTIFHFAQDRDYGKVKSKDLREIIENRLYTVYGHMPMSDRYSFEVRKNGSLTIASIDKEPALLSLVDRVDQLANEKLVIHDILPEEAALTGLYRMNYTDDSRYITALIQFSAHQCRIIFFRGHEILQIFPVINEGTRDKNVLNTIFSKILFQLDTGEIPGLDRIILADNSEGESATRFFSKNFPEVMVENFTFNPEKFDIQEEDLSVAAKHTTAIALAVKAAGFGDEEYPALSLIPAYILERQKVFKLQWHGIALLIAIGLAPIVLNHYYQANSAEIERLQNENNRHQILISEIESTVQETEYLEEMVVMYQGQLVLLEELVRNNVRWTTTLDRINHAFQQVGGIWITTMRQSSDGILIEGYSLYEDRIPAITRQFEHATLRNVRRDEIREQNLFAFTMVINEAVEDPSLYTPESSRAIREILEFNP